MKGYLITLEGIEGAGKSTALQHMVTYIKKRQPAREVIISREPGGTEVSEEVRQILLRHHQEPILPATELLLMFASRAQHITHIIKPALAAGKIVISDRLTDSSYAYQGAGRGIKQRYIEALEELVHDGLHIDLTLLLDIAPKMGIQRAARANKPDRIESEEEQFFTRVRKAYLQRAKRYPQRFRVINAEKNVSEVMQEINNVLDKVAL